MVTNYNDVYFEYKNVTKMMMKDFRGFIFEIYYKGIGFTKEDSYYLLKKQKQTENDLVLLANNLRKKNT